MCINRRAAFDLAVSYGPAPTKEHHAPVYRVLSLGIEKHIAYFHTYLS